MLGNKVMRDADLLALPPAEFEQLVLDAFRAARDGMLIVLSQSILAASSLVEDCWLAGETPTPGGRAGLLLSVLRWAVDCLRPGGAYHPAVMAWRPYCVLHDYYLQGQRAAEVAATLGIVENHLFDVLRKALPQAAQVLRSELTEACSLSQRRQYALEQRYQALTPQQQKVLRAAAIFDIPVPAAWLLRMAGRETSGKTVHMDALIHSPLIQVSPQGDEIAIHPELRAYLLPTLNDEERRTAYREAARSLIEERQDYLGGAAHWRAAGNPRLAAQILIEHAQELIAEAGLAALKDLLGVFRSAELGGQNDLWAQLKLLGGEVAESLNNLEGAAEEYRQALRAPDLRLRARAYYRLARLFERSQRLDEALAAYQRGIDLLEAAPRQPLMATLLIHRAWIFIQSRPDGERARADLSRAESLLQASDLLNWVDLRNAWASYYTHIAGDRAQAVQQRLLCWMLANELGDTEKLLVVTLNLGQDYALLKQYEQARQYLSQGLELARSVGSRGMEGQYAKVLGNSYFFEELYPQAIEMGEQAYGLFQQAGNRQCMAHACYDLAEAYAQVLDWEQGREHWDEGQRLAQELGDQSLLDELDKLAHTWPELIAPAGGTRLTSGERSRRILAYARQQGSITNEECRRLTGVGPAQAGRDLKSLVEMGQLVVVGQGRAARYSLP